MDVDFTNPKEGGSEKVMGCKLFDARGNQRNQNDLQTANATLVENLEMLGDRSFAGMISSSNSVGHPWTEIKMGWCPVGSALSYQLAYTDSGFNVVHSLKRFEFQSVGVQSVPEISFPSQNQSPWSISGNYLPIPEKELQILERICIGKDRMIDIERNTRSQANSHRWKEERKFRLSSSRFGAVFKRVSEWKEESVQSFLKPRNLDKVAAVNYGRKIESVAALKYEEVLKSLGHNVKVDPIGLIVPAEKPWLGASPDRAIFDPTEEDKFGLLEIKCPYSCRDKTPEEACNNSAFYIQLIDDVPKLKRTDGYYCQIMGQLGVSGFSWCDFVVYFPTGIIIERIRFDKNIWEQMVIKLESFYFQEMLPRLAQ